MSLALLEGYSSAEEEEDHTNNDSTKYSNSSDSDSEGLPTSRQEAAASVFSFPKQPPSGSSLPSAFDAFSEVTGPPQFLNNSVEEQASARQAEQQPPRHGRRRNRRENKDLPAGAVVQAKAQLVGVHERVRSDITGTPTSAIQTKKDLLNSTAAEGKRIVTAANPNAEDAAELLRMCLQCGIPKTFSSARGMVCPVCGDRPPTDPTKESDKKKGSTVKDKEKSKRMRGQSSHATWKSETEMQLRQHFD